MRRRSQAVAACLVPVLLLLCYVGLYRHYRDGKDNTLARAEEEAWLQTSTSWAQREKCKWLGFCGLGEWETHNTAPKPRPGKNDEAADVQDAAIHPFWLSGEENTAQWSASEKESRKIPPYVLEYAPLCYLFSGEEYWPSDIAEHLEHVMPHLDYKRLDLEHGRENISHLAHLNKYGDTCSHDGEGEGDSDGHNDDYTEKCSVNIYLQSDDDVETKPKWLTSEHNIPIKVNESHSETLFQAYRTPTSRMPYRYNLEDDEGAMKAPWAFAGKGTPADQMSDGGDDPEQESYTKTAGSSYGTAQKRRRHGVKTNKNGDDTDDPMRPPFEPVKPPPRGRSKAPMLLIVTDKGEGVVDAFWFFFYSYNLGNKVFNVRFGNHVGDWEHTAIRFQDGVPKAVFVSEHEFGDAYSYEAVEKIGKRPVVYSAIGTHAMYVTPGLHPYVLPWGLLHDETDRGPLWDPTLNLQSYVLNYTTMKFRSSTLNPQAPTSWLDFKGRWGDKAYPLTDHRQYRFAGQAHYVSGPLGPSFKNLGRQWICEGRKSCRIKKIRANPYMRPWTGGGPGLEMSSETIRHMFGGSADDEGEDD